MLAILQVVAILQIQKILEMVETLVEPWSAALTKNATNSLEIMSPPLMIERPQ